MAGELKEFFRSVPEDREALLDDVELFIIQTNQSVNNTFSDLTSVYNLRRGHGRRGKRSGHVR